MINLIFCPPSHDHRPHYVVGEVSFPIETYFQVSFIFCSSFFPFTFSYIPKQLADERVTDQQFV